MSLEAEKLKHLVKLQDLRANGTHSGQVGVGGLTGDSDRGHRWPPGNPHNSQNQKHPHPEPNSCSWLGKLLDVQRLISEFRRHQDGNVFFTKGTRM